MKIVFMGNPEFAIPSLNRLVDSNLCPVAVVTNLPQKSGRGRTISEMPVAIRAKDLGLELLQTDSLTEDSFLTNLVSCKPDLFLVVAFRILPKVCLDIPRLGSINLHASLLPEYRGPAPIQWALINGEEKTGLTTFLLKPSVDSGDILLQEEVEIRPEDDAGSLSSRMSKVGAHLLLKSAEDHARDNIDPIPQTEEYVTHAPKIHPKLGNIDWKNPAEHIHNLIRGLSPRPGAFTTWNQNKLKLFSTSWQKSEPGTPGTVNQVTDNFLSISAGDGILLVRELQIEGRKRIPVKQFLAGRSIKVGNMLGS